MKELHSEKYNSMDLPFFDGISLKGCKKDYFTNKGEAWIADSFNLLKSVPNDSIDLVFTSPPYALKTEKEYGNENESSYIEWIKPITNEIFRVLKDTGSFVLNIGNVWESGTPTRSLYVYKLLLSLCDPETPEDSRFHLAQEFFWFNPAKLPSPIQWVNVERNRVKDSVEYIWWLSKTPFPKADNRKVLAPYSESMARLISTGKYNKGERPSGWQASDDWAIDHGGSIPSNMFPVDLIDSPHDPPLFRDSSSIFNMIVESNTSSIDQYRRRVKEQNLAPHPATFPKALPEFFVRFLTDPGDIVVDPFAGSNTTGITANDLGRKWLGIEKSAEYVHASRYRWGNSNQITIA